MELSQYKFKVFIKANCYEICNETELNSLKKSYEEFNFDDVKSFCSIISNEPTYKSVTNRYRIPDEYNWNETYKKEATSLDEIMNIEEIRSIDYFEYSGENIHSVINQQKSWNAGDFDVASGKQVKLIAEKYKDYLFLENEKSINMDLISELDNLIQLASIAEKYNKDLWFFDGYYWQ